MPIDSAVLARLRNGRRVFVETGTCTGDGVAKALDAGFEECWSIECDGHWLKHARSRFGDDPRIHLVGGDSALLLPTVLAAVAEPAVVWLDAHPNASGEGPLRAELDALAGCPVRHLILVDDVRLLHWWTDTGEVEARLRAMGRRVSLITGEAGFPNDVMLGEP